MKASDPHYRIARKLDRLRDEIVGLLIANPLRGPRAAAAAGLTAADLSDGLTTDRQLAVESLVDVLDIAGDKVGNGIAATALIPHVIAVAVIRIDGRFETDEFQQSEVWLRVACQRAREIAIEEKVTDAIAKRLVEIRRLAAAQAEASRNYEIARRAQAAAARAVDFAREAA
ncbi:MAG: hypothetical protein AAF561_00390 [Planctomycetota bacterium]